MQGTCFHWQKDIGKGDPDSSAFSVSGLTTSRGADNKHLFGLPQTRSNAAPSVVQPGFHHGRDIEPVSRKHENYS